MKRIFCLVAVLGALALGTTTMAATFGPGNIVIVRVGDGTQTLTNTGNTVFLDEYTTNAIWAAVQGTLVSPVQSIQMPTNWVGQNGPLIVDGTAAPNGALSLSTDGRYLLLAGYGPTIGQVITQALDTTTTTGQVGQVARVIGLVDGYSHVYTTTTLVDSNEDENAIHGAVSLEGTNIWHIGEGALPHTGGQYTTRGSTNSTQVEELSDFNSRRFNIFNRTLYYSANHVLGAPTNTFSGITTNVSGSVTNIYTLNPFGGALPVLSVPTNFLYLSGVYSCTPTSSPAVGSPYDFALFNLNGGSAPDTLYVADSLTNAPGEPTYGGGAVLKYCYIPASNAWVSFGSIYAVGATGVTGVKNGTNVTLYITEGGTDSGSALNVLYPYIDSSGYEGYPANNPSGPDANANVVTVDPYNLNSQKINTRGIAFAPQGGDSGTMSSGAGVISVGPPFGPYFIGPQGGPFSPTNGVQYSVANLGGANASFTVSLVGFPNGSNFVTAVPPSGTLAPGATTIVTLLATNPSATGLSGGFSYEGTVLFKQGAKIVAQPLATLQSLAFFITPSSNFVASGNPLGPFTPSSTIYTLTNVTPTALPWTASTSASWDTLSATNGTLLGHTATNITVSITPNANTLSVGTYEDTLTFTNVTAAAPLPAVGIFLQVGFGFFDNFSTYPNGDIDGQNGWYNPTPGLDENGYDIVNGVLTIPTGYSCAGGASDEEPAKNIANTVITDPTAFGYLGMSVTVTSAPPSFNTWDFTFLPTGPPSAPTASVTYNEARTSTSDIGGGQYKWWTHVNGFDAMVPGTIGRNYGTSYIVIIVSDTGNSNCWVFVNPPDGNTADLFAMTPDTHDGPDVGGWGGPASPAGIGAVDIDNYCSAYPQAGYLISKIALSTNYTEVYNFLTAPTNSPPTDPFTAWQDYYFTGPELANPSYSGPNASPVGTGYSNTNQFLLGFNPTNSAAYLHIISVVRTNGNAVITYLGANGDTSYANGPVTGFTSRTNVLEFTTGTANGSYSSTNWTSTGQTNILSGGDGLGVVTNMVDVGGANDKPSRYYRIQVILP